MYQLIGTIRFINDFVKSLEPRLFNDFGTAQDAADEMTTALGSMPNVVNWDLYITHGPSIPGTYIDESALMHLCMDDTATNDERDIDGDIRVLIASN